MAVESGVRCGLVSLVAKEAAATTRLPGFLFPLAYHRERPGKSTSESSELLPRRVAHPTLAFAAALPLIIFTIKLSSGLPGMMADPCLPPLRSCE